MRRSMVFIGLAVVVLAVLSIAIPKLRAAPQAPIDDNEAVVYHGVTACGVERWSVKTGIDSDAHLVNQMKVVATTIFHLRSLTPPASLPSRSRIRPVETTVFSESGTLIRYKQEADSDYHLVLSDSGDRTMIAEIPAPQCVGSNSPFIHQISYVRRVFSAHFHPGDFFQYVHVPVTIRGVGFFDFLHGQSGVAPNGIELHPVLGISFGKSSSPPPPPTPAKTFKPSKPSGKFSLSAYVSPNPVSYGQYATLYAKTVPSATCTASVLYSTGYHPVSFDGYAKTAGSSGIVSWRWHMESRGTGGTAHVSCAYKGATKSAMASFSIA